MGRASYIFGLGFAFLILVSCQSGLKSPNELNKFVNRPIPTRIFIQRGIINDVCIQAKSDQMILEELQQVEEFYGDLGFQFEIRDLFYFNHLDFLSSRELSAHYNDSLNIFYHFPNESGPYGYSDFPWEYPAITQISSGDIHDWKLTAHEICHAFGCKHVHYSEEGCGEDGCSDTEIPISYTDMQNYPNIMTYSISEHYFLTPQQKQRMLLWYKIRFIYKIYDNQLSCPIQGIAF